MAVLYSLSSIRPIYLNCSAMYWVRYPTFFFNFAYFVNSNTWLMFDLTDNSFYPSAERDANRNDVKRSTIFHTFVLIFI